MKLKLFIVCGIFVVLGIFALAFYAQTSDVVLEQAAQGNLAALSGFEPGAAVTYHVMSDAGESEVGSAIVDGQGNLEILQSNFKLGQESAVTYNIQIDQSDRPVHLNLKKDKGQLSVSGKGAKEFSDILIESTKEDRVVGRRKIKTDWAGLFNTQSLPLSQGSESTRLVLYDNIQNDAQEYTPLTVEVYFAPGGGFRGSFLVNEFENLYCDDDPTELSVCDEDKMEEMNELIVDNYVIALASITEQMSAIMMQQVAIIGTFFDAKMQMQTERAHRKLHADAVKDYHPDQQLCQFGSFVKTVAKTEETVDLNREALSNILTSKYTNLANGSTSEGYEVDIKARLKQYREVYCDPQDNNSGLELMCKHGGKVGAEDPERMNKDIDYVRTVDSQLSLDVNFADSGLSEAEEDVIALARNLYWPKPLASFPNPETGLANYTHFMDARKVMAIHNVAHHSFSEIVALKSKSIATESEKNGPAFMKAMMKDFGLESKDIDDLLGEFPSYYAQMEVLTKKIYQNPDFYTNLYTKPANVKRIDASLDAIELMQTRDQFESSVRREMLMSLMVEEALVKHFNNANDRLRSESRNF